MSESRKLLEIYTEKRRIIVSTDTTSIDKADADYAIEILQRLSEDAQEPVEQPNESE